MNEMEKGSPRTAATEKVKTDEWAIAKRWTEKLSYSWTPISDIFLNNYHALKITTPEAMFIIQLVKHKWDEKAPYPGYKGLAERMGVSVTAARGYGRSLEKKKYLRREVRVDDTNIFHLEPLFEALEVFVNDAEAPSAKKSTNKSPVMPTKRRAPTALRRGAILPRSQNAQSKIINKDEIQK